MGTSLGEINKSEYSHLIFISLLHKTKQYKYSKICCRRKLIHTLYIYTSTQLHSSVLAICTFF